MHWWIEKDDKLILFDLVIERLYLLLVPLVPGVVAFVFSLVVVIVLLTNPLMVFRNVFVFLGIFFTVVMIAITFATFFLTLTIDVFMINVKTNKVTLERRYLGCCYRKRRVRLPLHGLVGSVSRVEQWKRLIMDRTIPSTHLHENPIQDFKLGLILTTGKLINITPCLTAQWFAPTTPDTVFFQCEDEASKRINAFLGRIRPNQPSIPVVTSTHMPTEEIESEEESDDEFTRYAKELSEQKRRQEEDNIAIIRAETHGLEMPELSGGHILPFTDKRKYSIDIPASTGGFDFMKSRKYSLDVPQAPAFSGGQNLDAPLLENSGHGHAGSSNPPAGSPVQGRYGPSVGGSSKKNKLSTGKEVAQLSQAGSVWLSPDGQLDPRLERYRPSMDKKRSESALEVGRRRASFDVRRESIDSTSSRPNLQSPHKNRKKKKKNLEPLYEMRDQDDEV